MKCYLLAVLLLIAMPMHAAETVLDGGPFTYEVFEVSVEHADLATCPDGLNNDQVFCRLTIAADQAHIFVFSYDGDQPLTQVRSYELEDGVLSF